MLDIKVPSWVSLTINDLCIPIDTISPSKQGIGSFRYIDISSIDNEQKSIVRVSEVLNEDAPSRARQIVRANDVLVSTVRPNLNAVAIVPPYLDQAICSTGFCVLRVRKNMVDSEFLFYWTQHPGFVQRLVRLERGIGYPSVSDSDVKNIPIPLPPISEQRRIAQILREADDLRKLRQQANERAQQLLPALFYDMFGDPVTNPKGWEIKPLRNFIVFLTSGSRGWAKYYSENGANFIRVQDLIGHRLNLSQCTHVTPPDTSETKRTKVKPNDLLFSITGTVGQVAVAPEDIGDTFISQHVAIVRLQNKIINPFFIATFLADKTGGQTQILKKQYGQTKPGFGLQDIGSLQVLVPPKELQDDFARKVKEIRLLEMIHEKSHQHLETLFQSLLSRAFTGELTDNWRKDHELDVSLEAIERELRFQDYGITPLEQTDTRLRTTDVGMEDREVLFTTLSDEQQHMIRSIAGEPSYMTTPPPLLDSQDPLSPHMQHRGLHLLATTGVIAQVILLIRPTGNIAFYPTAYRNVHPKDDSRDDDLDKLKEVMV